MSNIDDLIRERLNKLRNESLLPTSVSSSNLPPPNKKSSVEEVEFLLQQLTAQTDLDEKSSSEKFDVDSQIRQRLDRLKAESQGLVGALKKSTTSALMSPMDEVVPPPTTIADLDVGSDDDTCVMCDSAPSILCAGCYNDLYCQKCFAENHDPGENHQTKPIVRRKK